MIPVSAQWVADVVGGELSEPVEVMVTSVCHDSRAAGPGAAYVAFVGERADGHDFTPGAHAAGAVLSIVTRPVEQPHVLVADAQQAIGDLARAYLARLRAESELTVIGVTGSNGKTTTKDMLAQLLPDVIAPVGSFNNEIGLPATVLSADASTRHLVLEMGAAGLGHIAYLTDIAPLDVAAVLMVGTAHAGQYESAADIAVAKSEIFAGLVDGGVAVANADDPLVAAMPVPAGARRVTFGAADSDVRAEGVRIDGGVASFTLGRGDERGDVRLGFLGAHHVTNALAAATIALECGMSVEEVAAGLTAARPRSPHRLSLVERADGVRILDDAYNASPESMRAALHTLREIAAPGRAIAVVGEMRELGDAAVREHDAIGHTAVRLGLDRLLVVGIGARAAYDGAVREGSWGDEVAYVADIEEAREHLAGYMQPGDTVLVKASHGAGLWRLADQLTDGTE